jgi:hypothetical protein
MVEGPEGGLVILDVTHAGVELLWLASPTTLYQT